MCAVGHLIWTHFLYYLCRTHCSTGNPSHSHTNLFTRQIPLSQYRYPGLHLQPQVPSHLHHQLQPSSTTGKHWSLTEVRATSLSGAYSKLTPLSPPPGTSPTQTNPAAYVKVKVLAAVPMPARESEAPTPSFPSSMTRSQLFATGKSPTSRLSAKSDPRKATTQTELAATT